MRGKGLLLFISMFVLSIVLVGCGGNESEADSEGGNGEEGKTVGIAMPTKSSERWVADGSNMADKLEELGYETDLQYAEDVVENQVARSEEHTSELQSRG